MRICQFQAGIDRTNKKADKSFQFIEDWDIKPISFSFIAGENGQMFRIKAYRLTAGGYSIISCYRLLRRRTGTERTTPLTRRGERNRKNITVVQIFENSLATIQCENDMIENEKHIKKDNYTDAVATSDAVAT